MPIDKSTTPQEQLLYVPDGPTKKPTQAVVVLAGGRMRKRIQKRSQSNPPIPKHECLTVEQAFDYFYEPDGRDREDVDDERALRAVAFLLHWASEIGNQAPNSNLVNGLGFALEMFADRFWHVPNSGKE